MGHPRRHPQLHTVCHDVETCVEFAQSRTRVYMRFGSGNEPFEASAPWGAGQLEVLPSLRFFFPQV